MRIAFLWQALSGYFVSCISILNKMGCSVRVYYLQSNRNAPFEFQRLPANVEFIDSTLLNYKDISKSLNEFNPQILLISSWHIRKYRRIAANTNALRILCMDNQWLATFKQYLGICFRSIIIKPNYDLAFLPGERQVKFARKLGFNQNEIKTGLYAGDLDSVIFNGKHEEKEFIFAGRLVDEKGIQDLIKAYEIYLTLSMKPYGMSICGTGPLLNSVIGNPNLKVHGFLQPRKLFLRYANARIFILPSKFEPWGVVLHEAAASGLVLVASSAVGSSDELIVPGVNGLIFAPGDFQELAQAMLEAEEISEKNFLSASSMSQELALKNTPTIWAKDLIDWLKEHGNK